VYPEHGHIYHVVEEMMPLEVVLECESFSHINTSFFMLFNLFQLIVEVLGQNLLAPIVILIPSVSITFSGVLNFNFQEI